MATPAVLIPTHPLSGPLTMTSIEIASLVEARHDSVKRTIERLSKRGVIVEPPTADVPFVDEIGRNRTTTAYRFEGDQGKRDSIVVVARLSPEFTGRLVDRWHALETGAAVPAFQLEPQDVTVAKVRRKPAPVVPTAPTKTVDLARYAELLECENAHLRQRAAPAFAAAPAPAATSPRPPRRLTSAADRAHIVALFNAGQSKYAIAKATGWSTRAVGRILERATAGAEVSA